MPNSRWFSVTASGLLFVVLEALAVSGPASITLMGLGGSTLFAACIAALLGYALKKNQFGPALLVVLFSTAYAYHLNDALSLGVWSSGFGAGSESVQLALVYLVVFLLIVVITGVWLSRWGERWTTAIARRLPGTGRATLAGLYLALAVAAVMAFRTGHWSYYGASSDSSERIGGFRLELLYEPILVAASFVVMRENLLQWRSGARRGIRTLYVGVLLGLVLLLFFLQMRRYLLALLFGGLLTVGMEGLITRGLIRSPRRLIFLTAGVAVLSFLAFRGSAVWRLSASTYDTQKASDRIKDVMPNLISGETQSLNLDDRINYLWLDAVSIELQSGLTDLFPLEDAAWSSFVTAVPAILLPNKYDTPRMTCEAAFSRLGLDVDLPCTPTAEGQISLGVWGVLLVAIVWGVFVAAGSAFWAVGGTLGSTIAVLLWVPLFTIEASAFPMFEAVRNAAIVLSIVLVGAALYKIAVQALTYAREPRAFTAREIKR